MVFDTTKQRLPERADPDLIHQIRATNARRSGVIEGLRIAIMLMEEGRTLAEAREYLEHAEIAAARRNALYLQYAERGVDPTVAAELRRDAVSRRDGGAA